VVPRHTIKGNATVLKISKAAMVAAVLSVSAIPAIGLVDAVAQDVAAITTTPQPATTTGSTGLETKLSIPTVTVVDSTMDEAALRDALSGGFMKHVDELAKLSASSITIPEINLTMMVNSAGATQVSNVTYKDVVLANVKNGVAESASIGGTSSTSAAGSFSFGKLAANAIDLGALLALYNFVPGADPSQPMTTLYKDFTFEGGSFMSQAASCTFGKVAAGEFAGRPLKVSFAAMFDAANKVDAAHGNPSPEDLGNFIGFITDIFQAFKSSPVNLEGLSCSGTAEGKSFDFSIGGIVMDGYAPGLYPALEIKDVKFTDGDNDSFLLADAKLKTIDLHGPIAVLEAGKGEYNEAWFTKNARKFIPAFGGFSFSGLSFDVPNPDSSSERYQAKVADFDLSLSDYLNGIPTKFSTKASGVDVPLPINSSDDSVKMLQSIGITRINMNYEVSASWDKATNQINIDKVAASGNDLGSFAIAAVLGNATEQLFDLNPNVEAAASMGVTIKSVNLGVIDQGFEDKVIPLMAAEQKADPATFRTTMAAAAEGAAIAMLGSTDQARQLGAAISDFIAGTKKSLTINVASKDPAGIAMPLLMLAENNPAVLAGAVDITGSAE
jgi:hypothetical protein